MRVTPRRSESRPLVNNRRIVSLFSPEFGLAELVKRAGITFTNAWTSANDPLALPFRLNEYVVATRLGWVNGTTLTSSNFDIGIYDSAFSRLVAAGSTARVGGSSWQWVDISDTALGPGDYYLVGAADTATTSRVGAVTTLASPGLALLGARDSATDAFPLPSTLTNMAAAATFTIVPWMAFECTGTFAPAGTQNQRLPGTWMPESLYDSQIATIGTAGTFTNSAANQALYCPVSFPVSATIYSVSFAATNGTGNYDLGLYDGSFRRIASTGSTAMSAAGVKTLTVPDLHVDAGTVLYIAGVWSSISARFLGHSLGSLPTVIQLGCAEETSALPLPATGTPATPSAASNLPLYTIGVR